MTKMFTVALIGPDGAGKSTIGHKLEQVSPLPLKYIYMGVNLESSNMVLPTTRLWLEVKRARGQRPDIATRPRPTLPLPKEKHRFRKQLAASSKAFLRLVSLTVEEWYRQIVVWTYNLRGYSVILDRHFYFDYYAHDIANEDPKRPLSSRIHGLMLKKFYPKPDFVIFLDAPAEILFARKPEGTLQSREERRQEYIRLRNLVSHYAVVDVSRPEEESTREVCDLIMNYYSNKSRYGVI